MQTPQGGQMTPSLKRRVLRLALASLIVAIGDEPCVNLDFAGPGDYAKR